MSSLEVVQAQIPARNFKEAQRLVTSRGGGNLIWEEAFDGVNLSNRWTISNTAGTDGFIMLSTTNSLRTKRSVMLVSPAGANQQSEIFTLSALLPNVNRYGFEGWFSAPVSTGIDSFFFGMEHGINSGTPSRTDAWVKVKPGGVIAYYPAAGQTTIVTNWNNTFSNAWHHFKVVMDVSTDKWVSLEIDLTDYTSTVGGQSLFAEAAGAGTSCFKVFIAVLTNGTNNAQQQVFYDDLVVTVEG